MKKRLGLAHFFEVCKKDWILFWIIIVSNKGAALAIDTHLEETEKQFESEFKKLYGDKESEKAAAAELAKAEKQVGFRVCLKVIF